MAPKKKQEKMSLGSFLQDENYGSWADEMEDMPLPSTDSRPAFGSGGFGQRREFSSNATTGAERSFERQGYSVREQLPLPTSPPYTAHLANLSFDVTQPDVEEFFQGCEITNVRIVEDKMDRKPKGFGYVEFGTLDGLKKALDLTGSNLAGRQVRISVADPPKDRGGDPSRDLSDWSRKGPLPDLPQNNRRVSERQFSNRGFNNDNASDAGSERGQRRPFGGDREPSFRDMSNASWERKGPLSPVQGQDMSLRGAGRQGSREGGFRRDSPSWGEGRSNESSRAPRRDPALGGGDRPERPERPIPVREPTAAEQDNHWRAKMQPDAPAPKSPEPEASTPTSPAAAPGGRPRLNLQKRTVSEANPLASPASEDSKASPFGAARPIDTAAREREVEEKRQIAIRQKREADDKAKAERAEQKKNEKEREKPVRQNSAKDNDVAAEQNDDDEDTENKPPQPKFEVLKRQASENNDMIADDDDEAKDDADEAPGPERDTAVKPREIVRDAPKNANGSWRKKNDAPKQPPAESETAALEADGWSTVSKGKKQQNNRRQPARALAS